MEEVLKCVTFQEHDFIPKHEKITPRFREVGPYRLVVDR